MSNVVYMNDFRIRKVEEHCDALLHKRVFLESLHDALGNKAAPLVNDFSSISAASIRAFLQEVEQLKAEGLITVIK